MLVSLRTEAHSLTTPLPFLVFPMYIIKFLLRFPHWGGFSTLAYIGETNAG